MMIEIDELEYKSLKLDKECLLSLLNYEKQKIKTLKSKLENFESIQRGKCCECESKAIQKLSDMHFKTMPFEDDYFNGLTYKDIAELAKKSIRLTEENRRLEEKIEKLKGECEQSEYDYQNQLKNTNKWIAECEDLQKQLQTKEQECENLKEKIAQIKCEEIGKETFFEYKIKNYKQALDEIEEFCIVYSCNHDAYETVYKEILGIINNAKENK